LKPSDRHTSMKSHNSTPGHSRLSAHVTAWRRTNSYRIWSPNLPTVDVNTASRIKSEFSRNSSPRSDACRAHAPIDNFSPALLALRDCRSIAPDSSVARYWKHLRLTDIGSGPTCTMPWNQRLMRDVSWLQRRAWRLRYVKLYKPDWLTDWRCYCMPRSLVVNLSQRLRQYFPTSPLFLPAPCYCMVKVKCKCRVLAIAPLTWVRLATKSALQSRKWHLTGTS